MGCEGQTEKNVYFIYQGLKDYLSEIYISSFMTTNTAYEYTSLHFTYPSTYTIQSVYCFFARQGNIANLAWMFLKGFKSFDPLICYWVLCNNRNNTVE